MVNNKIYVGCHQTSNLDDGYMGSGRRLAYAKRKYGLENFKKEILGVYETSDQMFEAEARIVDEKFLIREDVYNLTLGGNGGWQHHNRSPEHRHLRVKGAVNANRSEKRTKNPEWLKKVSDRIKRVHKEGKINYATFTGKTLSETHRRKIGTANAAHQAGVGNSNFGKVWMFNDTLKQSRSVKQSEVEGLLTSGWNRGRKMKF